MDLPELHKDLLPSNINDRDVHEGLLYIPLIPASKYTVSDPRLDSEALRVEVDRCLNTL